MVKISLLSAGLFLCLIFSQQGEMSTSFEEFPAGTAYEKSTWEKDGFKVAFVQALDKNSSVDDEHAHSGSHSLRVTYPEGKFGPAESGGQAKLMLEPQTEYFASYQLRFSENFSWGREHKGGKLPGLAAGDNCSGGKNCDGTNGFSARYMWRNNGEAVLYLYHMDKPHKWGEDYHLKYPDGTKVVFPRGEWINLVERVKLNTVSNGQANQDGEVQIWYNGQEVLHLKGLRLVKNSDKIDNFYFSTFHGGNTPEWAPENTSWIWYDDLIISTKKEDVL